MKSILTKSSNKLDQINDEYIQDRLRERGVETLEQGDKLLAWLLFILILLVILFCLRNYQSLISLNFLEKLRKI